jgi:hypothetical protein
VILDLAPVLNQDQDLARIQIVGEESITDIVLFLDPIQEETTEEEVLKMENKIFNEERIYRKIIK